MKIASALALMFTLPVFAQQNPSAFPKVGTVDARFQSYNIEMVEVIGGRFWKPYDDAAAATAKSTSGTPGGLDPGLFEQRRPIDLANPRLRKLAAALGPAYVRVSGTWANTAYFQDSGAPAPAAPPEGFGGVLTRAEWKGVVDFTKAVGAEIVTSFATSAGTRDAAGVWTPVVASKFLAYNRSIGGPIAAAEFMNEPTFVSAAGVPAGYDAAAFGRDFAAFRAFFRKAEPHALLLGPGSVGEGIDFVPVKLLPTEELLRAMGPNAFDVFSYHFYGAVSSRCGTGMGAKSTTSAEAALSENWLDRTATVEAFYAGLRDRFDPGKPMWVTETGQAACGGDRWASTYRDAFRYVDQLGLLARRGVRVVMHNTLAASDYALVDERTLTPRPDYWVALLWSRTMGATVLDPGKPASPAVRVYAQCMKDRPGGVTMLALNLGEAEDRSLDLPLPGVRYTVTADDLASRTVKLNGQALQLGPEGDVPQLMGVKADKGRLTLPAQSITFLAMPGAKNTACR